MNGADDRNLLGLWFGACLGYTKYCTRVILERRLIGVHGRHTAVKIATYDPQWFFVRCTC